MWRFFKKLFLIRMRKWRFSAVFWTTFSVQSNKRPLLFIKVRISRLLIEYLPSKTFIRYAIGPLCMYTRDLE